MSEKALYLFGSVRLESDENYILKNEYEKYNEISRYFLKTIIFSKSKKPKNFVGKNNLKIYFTGDKFFFDLRNLIFFNKNIFYDIKYRRRIYLVFQSPLKTLALLPFLLVLKIFYRKNIFILMEHHGDVFRQLSNYKGKYLLLIDYVIFPFLLFICCLCDLNRFTDKSYLKNISIKFIGYFSKIVVFPPYCIKPKSFYFKYGPKQFKSHINVLFLGNLIPIKNALNLIRAMKNIPNNYKLEICGEGTEKRKLENFVNRYFLDERIIFSRPVFNKDLIYKFENNDILVIPSFSESFSRLGLESLINGLPLVLTQNSPLINFFSEDIIKIDPKSPQSIAKGIILASKIKLDSSRANFILKKYFSAKEYAKNFVSALEIQN